MADDINLGAELELKGLNQFLTGLKKVQGEGEKTKKGLLFGPASKGMRMLGRGARRTGRALKGLGKIAGAMTLGIGAGIGVALGKFGEFELQMARIGTLLEPGRKGMDEFGASVNRASVQFAQDAGVMADAVFQAISAGVDSSTESVNEFQNVVGQAAVGGFTDAATVVDGLTTAMNAFGSEAGTSLEIADKFFVANKLGKTTFEELSRALGRVAPTAKALGVSFEEVLAATVSLTKGGISTREVMSGLKATFGSIKMAGDDARKTAKGLGLDFSLQALKTKGLAGFMTDLVDKTKGNTIAQAELFGSIEAFNAVARLASQEGMKDFDDALKGLQDSAGATTQAFDRVAGTTGFKLKQIKQGFSRFSREIGAGLAEGFGINEISNIPEAIEDASVTLRSAAGSFATAFKTAFAPAKAFGKMDLTGMAKEMGKAVAGLANFFVKALRALPAVVSGIAEVAKGLGTALGFVTALMKVGDPEQGTAAGRKARAAGGGKIVKGLATAADVKDVLAGRHGKEAQAALTATRERTGAFMDVKEAKHLRRVAGRLINIETRSNLAASRRTQAAKAAGKQGLRMGEGLGAGGGNLAVTGGLAAAPGAAGGAVTPSVTAGAALEFPEMNINVEVNNTNEYKDQKQKDPPRRYSTRGRGSAQIEATVRRRYIVFKDHIAPISDEFIFSSFVDAVGV